MLASDHINLALMLIGHLKAAGRAASPSEMTRGLLVFQNMVDSSNATRSMIFSEVENQFPTVNQQQTYSWGTGGTWNAPRPVRITQANFLMPTSPTIRRPMKVWSRKQWADIALQAIYTYPEGMYCDYANKALDGTVGAANVYLEPIPDGAYMIETFSWASNVAPSALTTPIAFPPGYAEYWLNGLAIRLSSMHGLPVPDAVQRVFDKAQRALGIVNTALNCPRLQADEVRSGAGMYNYLSGLRNTD
jgi:hypothetical protein